MTEMARALLEVYPTMALDQYESHEFYGKKVKTLSLVCEQAYYWDLWGIKNREAERAEFNLSLF